MHLPPIATTTVGSFPRPGWLGDRTRSHITFRLEGALLQEALDDATLLILKRQEEIGLDLLTDGEQRRHHFISHVLAAWDGIDTVNLGVKDNYRRIMQQRSVPRVIGKVGAPRPGCFGRSSLCPSPHNAAGQDGRTRPSDGSACGNFPSTSSFPTPVSTAIAFVRVCINSTDG